MVGAGVQVQRRAGDACTTVIGVPGRMRTVSGWARPSEVDSPAGFATWAARLIGESAQAERIEAGSARFGSAI